MSARGTGYSMDEPMLAHFGSAKALVSWHLKDGRRSFSGQRAIDYNRDGGGGPRDFWRVEAQQARFALTTMCLDAVMDARQRYVLSMLCGMDRQLAAVAEELRLSESTVRRDFMRGLRAVDDKARELAGEALARTRKTLLPEDEG